MSISLSSSRPIFTELLNNRTLQILVVGALAFLFFFYLSYQQIEEEYYQVRDDGIITMSHGKNFVDYGFIGVSPSGGRVEAYSAPVQFFLYSAAYYLAGLDYATYAKLQTLFCTLLLGGVFSLFFWENRIFAFGLSALAALILSQHTAFLQWHGSGMENPVTHVLFVSTILVLYSSYAGKRIFYPFAILVFLAAISRIDSVFHIAPLLIIYALFWFLTYKNLKGLFFSLSVFLLWTSFHLWRYVYFGDLLPNTAYAQSISVGDRVVDLVTWKEKYIQESLKLSKTIFSYHGGYLFIALIPGLLFVPRDRSVVFLFVILLSLVATSFLNPFIFGQTRLDPVRSTTQLAPVVVLFIVFMIYKIRPKKHLAWFIPVSMASGFFALKVNYVSPYFVCCNIDYFDSFRKEFANVAEQHSLPRPTVSNPDLGVMSWHKTFNIVDLGMLGSPIMAKVENSSILSDYFFDYAAPDMIESHDYWSCRYEQSIFNDPRFRAMYDPIRERRNEKKPFCNGVPPLEGIWVRKDILRTANSRERRLIDSLKINLSVPRLRQELDLCQSNPDSNCVYVARTAFRFLPEFRQAGMVDALNDVFATSRTREFDFFLINGFRDPKAHVDAIEHVRSRRTSENFGNVKSGES